MDIITHGISGVLLGATQRDSSYARRFFWMGCALAPDLDIFSGLGGPIVYYTFHRRLLHGLPGAVLLVLLLAALYRKAGWGSFSTGTLLAGTAIFVHLLLDISTSFGTSLLYPFSSQSFHWDLLFAFDLWLAGCMLVCIGIGALRLEWRRQAAAIGLALAGGYLLTCLYCKHQARARLTAEIDAGLLHPGSTAVIPQPFSPLSWAGFVITPEGTWAGKLSLSSDEPLKLQLFPSPGFPRLLALADHTQAAIRFLSFARFPYIRAEQDSDRVTFYYTDLRFRFSGIERSNHYFGMKVVVSNDGHILYEGLAND